jgi:hypothetical protein
MAAVGVDGGTARGVLDDGRRRARASGIDRHDPSPRGVAAPKDVGGGPAPCAGRIDGDSAARFGQPANVDLGRQRATAAGWDYGASAAPPWRRRGPAHGRAPWLTMPKRSLKRLYRRWSGPLVGYARSYVGGNVCEAEALVNDGFHQMYRHWDDLAGRSERSLYG